MLDPLANVPDHTGDRKWAHHPNTIHAHYETLERVIDCAYSEPYAGHDSDFGVLYVGGGRYWPGVVVGVKLLRHIGYKGPIEIWHGHHSDEEPIQESDVRDYDVRIVNALEVAKTTKPRILRGWEAKLHAIMNTRFRRVLFLDADAYCVNDPTPYFNRFSDFAFWGENKDTIKWPRVVLSNQARNVISIQGGQLFIDREKAWPLVVITNWICQHSDFYFQHIFGDQDAWRLTLSLTDLPYTVIGPAVWKYPSFVCSIDNRKIIVHRVSSKLYRAHEWTARDCKVDFAPHLPFETFVWNEFTKLAEHKIEDCENTFKSLYNRRAQRVFDSPSSYDSDYITCIETLVALHNLEKIVDLGCGNGRITKEIARKTGVEVIGVDCVREILPESDLPNLSFTYGNAFEADSLPEGDILLVKDVLSYWPFEHINNWIRNILENPRWRFVVIANDTAQFPCEMPWGRYHGVNPELCESLYKLSYKRIRVSNKLVLLLETSYSSNHKRGGKFMHSDIWNAPPFRSKDGGFYRHPSIVHEFQKAMRQFREEVLSQEKPVDIWEPETRGIVTAGGGERYFPSLYIHLKILRMLGCQLPIEVWHLGPTEMDPIMESLLREPPISATVIDAREVEKRYPCRILNGWELKPYATYYSSFEEVLFLDADNLAIRSPCYLWEYPEYRSKGAIFWPDLERAKLKREVWEIFDLPEVAKVFHQERAFESGQYLINKHLCHRELRFALWLAEHSDFVFKHVYGDKECFHLAWRYLGTEYVMPRRNPGWITHTILQYDLDNQILFQHRCRDKWKREGNRRLDSLKYESECFALLDELRRKWSWKLWFNPNKGEREKAIIQELTSKTWMYERVGYDKRPMRFCNMGMITLGRAGREHTYDVFVKGGEVLVPIFGEDGKLTMVLRRENENRYVGQWLEYERMPIVLQVADENWNRMHKVDYRG